MSVSIIYHAGWMGGRKKQDGRVDELMDVMDWNGMA